MADQPREDKVKLYQVKTAQYLLLPGPDFISAQLRRGDEWEEGTITISRLLLNYRPSPVVVDIGANLGAYAVPMGLLLKPVGGTLHAFEPQRMVYYQLCGNLFANQLDNCFANNLAVGDSEREINVPVLDLATEQNVGSLSLDPEIRKQQGTISSRITRTEKVRMVRMDDFGLPPADLVKIDVEGLELEVIRGAAEYLKKSGNPPLLFEVWGDYMKGQIGKRKRLMEFVTKELGYETVLLGELCVAQHPDRKAISLTWREDKSLEIRALPPQQADKVQTQPVS
jgi:methyltransferase, FkbM family